MVVILAVMSLVILSVILLTPGKKSDNESERICNVVLIFSANSPPESERAYFPKCRNFCFKGRHNVGKCFTDVLNILKVTLKMQKDEPKTEAEI